MAQEPLEVRLTATDNASAKIDDVADKAERAEKVDPTVDIAADDNATPELREVQDRIDGLDGRTAEAILKAEQKNFKKDLRQAERELEKVDSTEAEAEVLADVARAEKNLAGVEAELKKLDGSDAQIEVEFKEPPNIERQGEGLGDKLGVGAIKGFAAAGVTGAIIAGVEQGFNRIKARAIFRQQFGLIKEDAERLGKEAAQLYANGWGESKGEVLQALGQVQQALVATGEVSESETKKIAEGALGISTVFGADVQEVIRSVGQLLKNDLAPNAESALDVLVEGLQGGANQAGDFFETIDEYSQHFSAFGLSAKDMTDIVVTGFQNGQRDADKLADAVKEMRIRTVEDSDTISDAYGDLGLDADLYRGKILGGGTAARDAFRDIIGAIRSVENPVEQNRLAIELIGTQYEDLGPTALAALDSITDGTVRVTGATDELTEAVEEATPQFEKLKRQGLEAAGVAAEESAKKINEFMDAIDGDEIESTTESTAKYREMLRKLGVDQDEIVKKAIDLNSEFYDMSQEMVTGGSAMSDLGRATGDTTDDMEDLDSAVSDAGDEVNDLQDDFADLRGEMDDRSAFLNLQDSFDDLADKGRDAWQATAEMADDAERQVRDYERAQIDAKEEVIDYADELGNVPKEVVSDVLTLIDEGKFAEAQAAVDSFDKTVYVDVVTRYTDQRGGQGPVEGPGSTSQRSGSSTTASRSAGFAPANFAGGAPVAAKSSQVHVHVGNIYGTEFPEKTKQEIAAAVRQGLVADQ